MDSLLFYYFALETQPQVQNPVILIIFACQSNKNMEDEFDIRDARVPESEREYENALRPLSFHDFSGQA